MKNLLLAALALWALADTSFVDAQPESAYYGLSIGELDYADEDFGLRFADSVDSWRLMVGYMFMEHLGVEGSYGEASTIRDTVTLTQVEAGFESEISKMLTVRLLGLLPFENGISLMAGLGYVSFEQDITLSEDGVPFLSGEFSDSRPAYYFGVQYDWDRIALRLGYEKLDFDGDVDADETSLTFFYKL
jgi:opacity protein-like surface antigen